MAENDDQSDHPAPKYKRVLLKISGEGFCKPKSKGIDGDELETIAREILEATKGGAEVAVVCGGGNIIRGAALAKEGHIPQATADYMGMLGTVINGLALKEMLEKLGQQARLMTAINLTSVAEPFIRGRALRHLEKGRVVIFAAGTGNPFFTTDTAAALRAVEIGADAVLKATKVDGVYDKDPMKHEDAVRYDTLTFDEAIAKGLKIMDISAFDKCQEHGIPIVVFNMKKPGHIAAVVAGEPYGTVIAG
ncbi:MAG: UMP kinase [Phycisphaera sp.]|nr:UMP kinase [Phycisphaera sp.]